MLRSPLLRALLPLAVLLAGCPDHHDAPDAALPPDATTTPDGPVAIADAGPDAGADASSCGPSTPTRDLDILFVVDNSGSMGEEQQSLAANFPVFMNVLKNIQGGLPNVHIGVVSSNVGVGGYNITGCTGQGDNGALQATPRVPGCQPPTDAFISDVLTPGGTVRVKNYAGTLEDTFSCISQLGTAGCGFEQHLESMKRALDGNNPANTGFLRPDAYLAVIIIADEDDCSAVNSSVFDPNDTSLTGMFGPLASFRCTEFGITCAEGNITRSAGNYTSCTPRFDSPYIRNPKDYADFIKSLKCDPNKIIVSAIVGNTDPVAVALDEGGKPKLQPSCSSSGNGTADPAVRIQYFLDQFPVSTITSICNNDLSASLQQIAERLAGQVGP